jgi:hypothetical protein
MHGGRHKCGYSNPAHQIQAEPVARRGASEGCEVALAQRPDIAVAFTSSGYVAGMSAEHTHESAHFWVWT